MRMSSGRSSRSMLFSLTVCVVISTSFINSTTASSQIRNSVDPKVAMIAALNTCQNSTQLDCIESIAILDTNGTRSVASQTSPATDSAVDSYGQTVEDGGSTWSYKDMSGTQKPFTIDATLTTPAFVVSGSQGGDTETGNPTEEASPSPSSEPINPNSLDTRSYEPKLRIDLRFEDGLNPRVEIVLRASWLQLYDIQLPGKGASIQTASITGGQKLTLTGSPTTIYQEQIVRNQLTGESKKVVLGSTYFSFEGLHPTADYDFAECASAGYISWSSNAVTASLASLSATAAATFKMTGPKTTSSGTTNLGFFEARLPLSLLACRDSKSLLPFGKNFTSTIIYTDGTKLSGQEKSNVALENGTLVIKAYDFNFARTEITISTDEKAAIANKASGAKPSPSATPTKSPMPTPSPTLSPATTATATPTPAAVTAKAATKITTITCVKGKSTKKVSGANPKCPTGYKKK